MVFAGHIGCGAPVIEHVAVAYSITSITITIYEGTVTPGNGCAGVLMPQMQVVAVNLDQATNGRPIQDGALMAPD